LLLIACGAVGYLLGRRLRLPAGHLTGPILVSGIAHATGVTAAAPPQTIVAAAQLVIGVTLGLRFVGLTGAELRRWFGLAALVVAGSLTVGAGFAALCAAAGVAPFEVMALCFAPGGVVEMGLIALSLEASPILVTTHHLARIAAAVIAASKGWVVVAAGR
jgi:membrane AbrB-like protein